MLPNSRLAILAALIGESEGIGVDLAIVDPSKLGRGFGRAMLASYLRGVAFPLFPQETRCFIGHALENHRAIACSEAIGFTFLRTFLEDGNATGLFVLERDKWACPFG
jgi:RimJ/RimL family protein N-acetyltransferase